MTAGGRTEGTRAPIELPPWAQVSGERIRHIERVASLVEQWAREMDVAPAERRRWLKAVSLHDAVKDAPPKFLDQVADDGWNVPALKHGPAAAVLAARDGERDQGVLDAVRFHSVGFGGWDAVGQVLYLADYLEPGRTFHQPAHASLTSRVPRDVRGVLETVAVERLTGIIAAGLQLLPESVDFWNGLVG